MESANRDVTHQDRLLWGMSPRYARLVLIGCLAALVYVVRGELVDSPKARVRMDELSSELASILASTRPEMQCTGSYGPRKAIATCRYSDAGNLGALEQYYDRAFATRGWNRCGGTRDSETRYSLAYCRGEDHASVDHGYTAPADVNVSLSWGLP
jgi:hypothetical protein